MNPLCFVCQEQAVKVCQHTECSFPPFLCNGPCTRKISQKMHTHNGVQNFIPFEEFQQRVEEIKRTLDPICVHKEFLEQMKKKIILAKDHLQQQILSLDKVYEQLENDLCVELKMKLRKECQTVLENIDNDLNGESLTGKDLLALFSEQRFVDQGEILEIIETVKEGFMQGLKKVEEVKVEEMFEETSSKITKVKDIYPGDENLNIKVKVVELKEKIQKSYGKERNFLNCVLADESGSVNASFYKTDNFKKDDVIILTSAIAKVVKGHIQIQRGKYGRINKLEGQMENPNTTINISHKYYELVQ